MITESDLVVILEEVEYESSLAADKFFNEKMGGNDGGACGFAWVSLYKYDGKKIKGNTTLGRALKKLGVRQDYTGTYQIWNPSHYPCQNIDTLEAGASAAAEVFKKYGIEAYAGSRMD